MVEVKDICISLCCYLFVQYFCSENICMKYRWKTWRGNKRKIENIDTEPMASVQVARGNSSRNMKHNTTIAKIWALRAFKTQIFFPHVLRSIAYIDPHQLDYVTRLKTFNLESLQYRKLKFCLIIFQNSTWLFLAVDRADKGITEYCMNRKILWNGGYPLFLEVAKRGGYTSI